MSPKTGASRCPSIFTEDRKRRILIVEDEYVNQELLKAYLENDYELLLAANGA